MNNFRGFLICIIALLIGIFISWYAKKKNLIEHITYPHKIESSELNEQQSICSADLKNFIVHSKRDLHAINSGNSMIITYKPDGEIYDMYKAFYFSVKDFVPIELVKFYPLEADNEDQVYEKLD